MSNPAYDEVRRQMQRMQQPGRGKGRGRGRGGRGRGRGNHRGGRGGRGGRGRFNNHYGSNSNHNSNDFQINDEDVFRIEEIGTNDGSGNSVRIAVQGCSHGALENIYNILESYQQKHERRIDLLLCCGDFQALRNTTDFETISVPPKYRNIGSFYKYYSGEKIAPILTIVIGGNHESSSYMQELYYGGWLAPNVYYLGACGVVNYRGIRIGGMSGIYKDWDYRKGRFEFPPYDNKTLRSVYHVRNFEVARFKLLAKPQQSLKKEDEDKIKQRPVLDIMMSHDWPRGIEQHGNVDALLRKKKFFEQEIRENNLGSPANEEMLYSLKPSFWFAAHLHVKFQATFQHKLSIKGSDEKLEGKTEDITSDTTFIALDSDDACNDQPTLSELMTKFLSLDKCLPKKHHLQIVNVSENELGDGRSLSSESRLCYDLEWLAILQKTHHWTHSSQASMPDPDVNEIDITQEDIDSIRSKLEEINKSHSIATAIPENFTMTLRPHGSVGANQRINQGRMVGNPQTDDLLKLLGLDHIITVPYIYNNSALSNTDGDANEIDIDVVDNNEIDIDEEEEDPEISFSGNIAPAVDENEIDLDDL